MSPATLTLSASTFNWTREIQRALVTPVDIVSEAAALSPVIELELGQLLRSFPSPDPAELARISCVVATRSSRVSIVGASLDEWTSTSERRTTDERAEFLRPQLRAAKALGAQGVRLPFGQPDRALLETLAPTLVDLDLVLYQEIQGQQVPGSPGYNESITTIDALNDPHLRVLLDSSMLMPSLPTTYVEALAESGVPPRVVAAVSQDWSSPDTATLVRQTLEDGLVPQSAMPLFITLLVRFGRATVDDLAPLLPYVGAVHLKFWDLDDSDGRVSGPVRDLAVALKERAFTGTLCSEWGGHDWLVDEDPAAMTAAHLGMVRSILARERIDTGQPAPSSDGAR
jgi:hypothetical protein